MRTKKGAGGRQQNYDSHGRYAKTVYQAPPLSRREKSEIRRKNVIEKFCIAADKKRDPLVKQVLLKIEEAIPYAVQCVNENKFDALHNKVREFDIITRRVIIEIKSGKARHVLSQLVEQKEYADYRNKKYVVFAPNIAFGTKNEYNRNGIEIKTNIHDLIKFIKENEK